MWCCVYLPSPLDRGEGYRSLAACCLAKVGRGVDRRAAPIARSNPPPQGGGGRRSLTEGEDGDVLEPLAPILRPACFLPLRRLRRHLPLAGEDIAAPPFPTAPRLCHGLTTMSATTPPRSHRLDARVALRSRDCPAPVASPARTGRLPGVRLSRRRRPPVARMSRPCRVGVASQAQTRPVAVASPRHTPFFVSIVRTVAP